MPDRRGAALKLATLPIHPFLLAAAVVLHFALEASVHVHAVVRPLGVAMLGVAAILAVLSVVFRSIHPAGLAATVVIGLLLARWFWLLNRAMLTTAEPWQAAVWFTVLLALLVLAARIVLRRARAWEWPVVTRRINAFAGALLLVVLGSAVASGGAAQAMGDLRAREDRSGSVGNPPRDIFVLLLDGYPRADTLERVFDLDNSPFLDHLADRGFDVATASRSNYIATQLTLMSMFHMTHLEDLPGYRAVLDGEVREDPRVRTLINDNPVFDRLDELGYRLISVAPGIERVTLRSVDTVHDSMQLSEFEYHLIRSSAVGGLWSMMDPAFMARLHRERVIAGMGRVEELAREPVGGRFVFGHILSPHMPAVFNRDGSFRQVPFTDSFFQDSPSGLGITLDEFLASYRDQLLALNDRVTAVVDTIVAENPEAVVVILSDHGSAAHFDVSDVESDLDERFANLFAARTPEHTDVFSDSQTPVNVFPRLFNAYFGDDHPLRADTTWFGLTRLIRVENPDAGGDTAGVVD